MCLHVLVFVAVLSIQMHIMQFRSNDSRQLIIQGKYNKLQCIQWVKYSVLNFFDEGYFF